jgi:hypothetical protein
MLAYETILLSRLNLYGSLVSRAGHSRLLGIRINDILQGVTDVMLFALGVQLAFEQK